MGKVRPVGKTRPAEALNTACWVDFQHTCSCLMYHVKCNLCMWFASKYGPKAQKNFKYGPRKKIIAHPCPTVQLKRIPFKLNVRQCVTVLFTLFRVTRNSGCRKFDFRKPGITRKFNGTINGIPEVPLLTELTEIIVIFVIYKRRP